MADAHVPRRTAVVTGASQGIGRAIAARLAGDGFRVWAVARRREPLEELRVAELADRILPAPCDLTDAEAVSDLAATIASRTPELAALVHCAGTILHGSFTDTTPDQLTRQIQENVAGAHLLTQLLLPRLSDHASIVVLNSTQGLRASATAMPFAASMHALRAVTDALRDEVERTGHSRHQRLPRPHGNSASGSALRAQRLVVPARAAPAAGRHRGRGLDRRCLAGDGRGH